QLLQFFQTFVRAESQNHVVRMSIFFDEPPGSRTPFIFRQHARRFVSVLCRQALLPQVQWLTNMGIRVQQSIFRHNLPFLMRVGLHCMKRRTLIYPALAFCQPSVQTLCAMTRLRILTFSSDLSKTSLAQPFMIEQIARILLLLFALAPLMPDATHAIAAQPSKVRISYSSRSNSVTPFWVALQRGFFKEENLDLELIQVN